MCTWKGDGILISIIDRCEQKYFISNEQYESLLNKIVDKLCKDEYFFETIYNLYFDNDGFELINKSLDKPEYKEKIRLRSYEIVNGNSVVFLEIKKKYNDHTNKRRIIIKYDDYLNYINDGIVPKCDRQIFKEIDYCFKKYLLKPKIKIRYDRTSYYLKDDKDFRITFDNNVRYSLDNLDFTKFDSEDSLLFKDGYIMEFKTFNGIPLWLNKILSELKIYPTSFSKVGKICEGECKNV